MAGAEWVVEHEVQGLQPRMSALIAHQLMPKNLCSRSSQQHPARELELATRRTDEDTAQPALSCSRYSPRCPLARHLVGFFQGAPNTQKSQMKSHLFPRDSQPLQAG